MVPVSVGRETPGVFRERRLLEDSLGRATNILLDPRNCWYPRQKAGKFATWFFRDLFASPLLMAFADAALTGDLPGWRCQTSDWCALTAPRAIVLPQCITEGRRCPSTH